MIGGSAGVALGLPGHMAKFVVVGSNCRLRVGPSLTMVALTPA